MVCSTYRLTEMYHYWTKHTDRLNEIRPGFFIELPEELAKEKGITNGSQVRRGLGARPGPGRGNGDETPPADDHRRQAGVARRLPLALGLHRTGRTPRAAGQLDDP